MAARTGASVGVAVTISVLGVISLALFVTTMFFYGQTQRAKSDLAEVQDQYDDFIRDEQRERAVVRAILDEARSENQTVVAYLAANRTELLGDITGDTSTGMTEYRDLRASIEGIEEGSYIALLEGKDGRIETLGERLAEAEAARQAAQEAAEFEAARVAQIESDFNASAQAMRDRVAEFAARVQYLEGTLNTVEQRLNGRIEQTRADSSAEVRDMQARLDAARRDNAVLRDQVARLRGEGKSDRLEPLDEAVLVDGRIDQLIDENDEVLLSIGRDAKAVLGMTFAIYGNPTDIKINEETGEYEPGKAVIEIIRVEDDFSRARIISQSAGNPIIRGDVIANAVYDPRKTYKFVVDGLFDLDGDGVANRYETDELEALIGRWGGIILDDVAGDTDFVVLGEKPVLPPPPGPGAPIAAMQEFVRLQRQIQRYDDLLTQARDASIPLLNANRLQTLIGDFPG